jgi:hypothetical protein
MIRVGVHRREHVDMYVCLYVQYGCDRERQITVRSWLDISAMENKRVLTGRLVSSFILSHYIQPDMSSIASSSRSVLRSLPRSTRLCARQASRPVTLPLRTSIPLSLSQTRSFFSLNDITKLASSLTGSDNGDGNESRGVESDGEFQKFHARKILPFVPVDIKK